MNHVVSLSGGLCSFFTALRVAERYGTANLTTVFADTRIEHADLYRFLDETLPLIGGTHVTLDQGKDVWDVFFEGRFLGNSRVDLCSRVLKREPITRFMKENFNPSDTTLHLGFDIEELHRFERARQHWLPYTVEAVLTEKPYLTRPMMVDQLAKMGIELPELYKLGFAHNNCGGFCIKAGHAQFKQLLEHAPETYAYHRDKEQEFREFIGKDVAILRRRTGGVTTPLTLYQLEQEIRAGTDNTDPLDFGGCNNCFVGDDHGESTQNN